MVSEQCKKSLTLYLRLFLAGQIPDGVTIKKSEEVSKTISKMENMEVYIADKCFEV